MLNKLNEILALVKSALSEEQIKFISSYMNAGEWNLAIETLCEIFTEEELPLDSRVYELLQEVGSALNIEREIWEMLKVQVTR